jgi:(p)ppGpp synthase/HD superfamily hydrolase
MHTVTDQRDRLARLQIGISINGLPQLSRVLTRIRGVANVVAARRKK